MNSDEQTAVSRFAEEARLYVDWAQGDDLSSADAARRALRRIVALYAAALYLPEPDTLDVRDKVDTGRGPDNEFDAIYLRAAALPFSYYSEVHDPRPITPEESLLGDLGDDIADIFRDVATGLRLYKAGNHGEAAWMWAFNWQVHWGAHAASAIRALHWHVNGPKRGDSESGAPDEASPK